MSKLSGTTVRVSDSMDSLGGKFVGMGALFAGGLAIAGAGLAAFGLKSISASADMEQSRIAFGTLLGSAQAAGDFLHQLADFAAKTPFEFTGLQQSARQLLAFGFSAKEIIPMMTAIGDAVAGLGGGQEMIDRVTMALGQMRAKGKVSAEEMMQLAEAGIPAWEFLARAIGTDIPTAMKRAELGQIDAATGVNAVLSGMEGKFGGLMAKQSASITGMWSNVQDAVGQTMVAIGDKISQMFDVKAKLQGLLDFLTRLQAFAQGKLTLGQLVGPEAAAALVRVQQTLERVGEAVGQVMERTRPLAETLERLALPHLDAIIIFGLAAAFGLLAIAAGAAAVAVIAATWPVLAIIAAIGLLAAGVYLVIQNWSQITGFLGGLWAGIQAWFGNLLATAEAAWAQFSARPGFYVGLMVGFVLGKLVELLIGASQLFNRIVDAVAAWAVRLPGLALQAAIALSRAFYDETGRLPGQMVQLGADIVLGLWQGFQSLNEWFARQVYGFFSGLVDGAKAALGIHSPSAVFADIGRNIVAGLNLGLNTAAGSTSYSRSLTVNVSGASLLPMDEGRLVGMLRDFELLHG